MSIPSRNGLRNSISLRNCSKSRLTKAFSSGDNPKFDVQMRSKHVPLVAALLILVLPLLLQSAVPMVHADAGGTQVRVESVTLSPDETTLIVVVSATINDPTVKNVYFDVSVSYGDHRLNINKQGTLFAVTNSTGAVVGGYATATFDVPFLGPGYYLIVTNAYNAATGALLGSAWIDPREGTAC